jgi:serine/threonine protein kinase
MQAAGSEISTCPNCGQPLQETFGGRLGCMPCWLRAGVSGEDDELQNSTPDAFDGCQHFGVYKIDRRGDGSLYELGHGAMGITYRATDTALQRKVALKITRTAVAGRSKDTREAFLREARAAAALRHEHIATIFQFGIRAETGQCFYAMEVIEGETLEERVRRAGPLDIHTTICIAQQVATALAAAEKRALVHSDLKPANLMLVKSDDGEELETPDCVIPTVKIIDFGLAKNLNAPVNPMRLTHGGFVGTPAFASPEQFENDALDARSDIYSLGATLWFALTGRTPFGSQSVQEIQRAQRSNVLPMEQLNAAQVPPRFRSLLRSMLAVEPAARPSTRDLGVRLQHCAAEASGTRYSRIGLAAVFILPLGMSAFFTFASLRTNSPATGSNSDASRTVDSIRSTSPPVLLTKIRAAQWAQENGASAVPRTEEDVLIPETVERYSVAEATTNTEKKASHNNRNVTHPRTRLFKKLVTGFIKLQKKPTKSSRKIPVQR